MLSELASEESLRRGGLGVVRIAERLGREKSQVSRALRALEAEGMVERDPRTRTYQLGWALYTLAARGVETRLVRAAATRLRGLAEDYGQTVRLCVLIGGRVLTLVVVPPGHAISFGSAAQAPLRTDSFGSATQAPLRTDSYPEGSAEAGVRVGSTAAGPALLLDWPTDSLDQLPGQAEPNAESSELAERIELVRIRGYASQTDGRAGWAAPVRDFRGIVLAAIELAGPPDDADPATLCAAAEALSADLGHELPAAARR